MLPRKKSYRASENYRGNNWHSVGANDRLNNHLRTKVAPKDTETKGLHKDNLDVHQPTGQHFHILDNILAHYHA